MRLKGFLIILVLALVVVYIVWMGKFWRKDTAEDFKAYDQSKLRLTKTNMNLLGRIIKSYIAQKGETPESLKELQKFYVFSAERLDAWGNKIKYERISELNFRLISAGRDRVFNTSDDIILNF